MGALREYVIILGPCLTPLTSGQSNILVENSGHARIADIGLAEISKNLNSIRSISNQDDLSMRWTAPEVWSPGEHSEKVDIFSFAMVMIEVCYGWHALPNVIDILHEYRYSPAQFHSVTIHLRWLWFSLHRASVRHDQRTQPSLMVRGN